MAIIYFLLVTCTFPLGYPMIDTNYDTAIFLILLGQDLSKLMNWLRWSRRWWC